MHSNVSRAYPGKCKRCGKVRPSRYPSLGSCRLPALVLVYIKDGTFRTSHGGPRALVTSPSGSSCPQHASRVNNKWRRMVFSSTRRGQLGKFHLVDRDFSRAHAYKLKLENTAHARIEIRRGKGRHCPSLLTPLLHIPRRRRLKFIGSLAKISGQGIPWRHICSPQTLCTAPGRHSSHNSVFCGRCGLRVII